MLTGFWLINRKAVKAPARCPAMTSNDFPASYTPKPCRAPLDATVAPAYCLRCLTFATVWRWMKNDDDFRSKYQVAMELRSQRIDDDIDDIIGEMRRGEMDAQSARVVIDTYKWRMAKLYPKFYGENKHIEVEHKANSFIDELRLVAEKVEERKMLEANTIDGDVVDVKED